MKCTPYGKTTPRKNLAERSHPDVREDIISIQNELFIMTDSTAETARLMKVTEAIVAELDRQGITEAAADLGFDPLQMARVVIRAADGDVISFQRRAE